MPCYPRRQRVSKLSEPKGRSATCKNLVIFREALHGVLSFAKVLKEARKIGGSLSMSLSNPKRVPSQTYTQKYCSIVALDLALVEESQQ